MMVFRIRDISFTWRAEGWGESALSLCHPPPAAPPSLAPSDLVSDVVPQLHQNLVEEGELGDQRLGLLACQGPGRGGSELGQPWPPLGNGPAPARAAHPPPRLAPPPLPAQRTRGQAAAEAGDLLPTSGPFRLLGPPHLGWSGVRWSLGRKGKRGQRAGTWRGAWLARGRRRDRDRRPESRNKDGLPGGRRRAATASGAERESCPNPSGSRARQ